MAALACVAAFGLPALPTAATTVTVSNQQSGNLTVYLGFTGIGCYAMSNFGGDPLLERRQ
jgi:hypothetical protein